MPSLAGCAHFPGQRELLIGECCRLLRVAERHMRGDGVGAPGCNGGIVNAECMPAFGRREQVTECLAGAALRDPEGAPGLQEEKGVDPPGGWVTVSGGCGDVIGLVEAAEARERVDAERGGPGDGQRRGGRELEIQRQLAVGGSASSCPSRRMIIDRRQLA